MNNFFKKYFHLKASSNFLVTSGILTREQLERADMEHLENQRKREFPYVVAQLWRPNDAVTWKNLSIYSYGGDVLFGTKKDADGFLEYVKRQKRYDGSSYDNDPENNPWKIYEISFEEV